MSEGEPLVEMHGMRDGVEPLERDECQGEDRQLAGEYAQKAGHLATQRGLPLDGVLLKLP